MPESDRENDKMKKIQKMIGASRLFRWLLIAVAMLFISANFSPSYADLCADRQAEYDAGTGMYSLKQSYIDNNLTNVRDQLAYYYMKRLVINYLDNDIRSTWSQAIIYEEMHQDIDRIISLFQDWTSLLSSDDLISRIMAVQGVLLDYGIDVGNDKVNVVVDAYKAAEAPSFWGFFHDLTQVRGSHQEVSNKEFNALAFLGVTLSAINQASKVAEKAKGPDVFTLLDDVFSILKSANGIVQTITEKDRLAKESTYVALQRLFLNFYSQTNKNQDMFIELSNQIKSNYSSDNFDNDLYQSEQLSYRYLISGLVNKHKYISTDSCVIDSAIAPPITHIYSLPTKLVSGVAGSAVGSILPLPDSIGVFDQTSFEINVQPTKGKVIIAGKTFKYIPASNQTGALTDEFEYIATSGASGFPRLTIPHFNTTAKYIYKSAHPKPMALAIAK